MAAILKSPIRLAMLVILPALSACTADMGPGYGPGPEYGTRPVPVRPAPPPRPRPPQPQMCTMEYAPVCGERGGRTQTFGNACQARNSGFQIVGRGECRAGPPMTPGPGPGPRPPRPRPPHEEPMPPQRPGGICTREYRPVCGERGREMRTFSNSCEAGNAGFRIVGQGECRR